MTEKPILYHMPNTRSGSAIFMDEELGGVCELRLVNLRAGDARKADYLKLNPMGKVPTLVHQGVVVTETAAICAYLADAFAQKGLAPAIGGPLRGAYYRWLFFSPSVVEPTMLDRLGKLTRENSTAAGHGDYERVMSTINAALSKGPWLLGERFSAADVVMGSTLNFATLFGAFPNDGHIKNYVGRVTARPAFQSMMKKNAELAKGLGL
jgi:glutathione S-transferase